MNVSSECRLPQPGTLWVVKQPRPQRFNVRWTRLRATVGSGMPVTPSIPEAPQHGAWAGADTGGGPLSAWAGNRCTHHPIASIQLRPRRTVERFMLATLRGVHPWTLQTTRELIGLLPSSERPAIRPKAQDSF